MDTPEHDVIHICGMAEPSVSRPTSLPMPLPITVPESALYSENSCVQKMPHMSSPSLLDEAASILPSAAHDPFWSQTMPKASDRHCEYINTASSYCEIVPPKPSPISTNHPESLHSCIEDRRPGSESILPINKRASISSSPCHFEDKPSDQCRDSEADAVEEFTEHKELRINDTDRAASRSRSLPLTPEDLQLLIKLINKSKSPQSRRKRFFHSSPIKSPPDQFESRTEVTAEESSNYILLQTSDGLNISDDFDLDLSSVEHSNENESILLEESSSKESGPSFLSDEDTDGYDADIDEGSDTSINCIDSSSSQNTDSFFKTPSMFSIRRKPALKPDDSTSSCSCSDESSQSDSDNPITKLLRLDAGLTPNSGPVPPGAETPAMIRHRVESVIRRESTDAFVREFISKWNKWYKQA